MIRQAQKKDVNKILDLLCQVDLVHHNGRPDIFKVGTKYDKTEITNLLGDEGRPILVYVDDHDEVLGYCFCILIHRQDDNVLTPIKTLYIDDLCVDENHRSKGIGKALYLSAKSLAKDLGCYNVTLNVWAFNEPAMNFYKSLGLAPQKIVMESIL